MNFEQQLRLLGFLKENFNQDGSIHFLAVAAIEHKKNPNQETIFKVRVALTFQDQSGVNPYFDGTDLYVAVTPTGIRFTKEDEWADGPPIREGSPLELALSWVSEFTEPFFVSPQAQIAAGIEAAPSANKQLPEQRIALNGHDEDYKLPEEQEEPGSPKSVSPQDFDKWF